MPADCQFLETPVTDSSTRPGFQGFLVALTLLAVIPQWILPASSSFWLDETMTYWVISDGFQEVFSRALFWSGESPFYYLIAWAAKSIGHSSEFIIRLPSLVAMGLAAYLVFHIGFRLIDRETGLFGAVFFACSNGVAFAAGDARPYALAMLMLLASTFMLLRWLEGGRLQHATGYVLFSALTIYAHYIFSAGLLVPALYALSRVRHGHSIHYKGLFAAWLSTGLLVAPAMPNLLAFYKTRSLHLFPAALTWVNLVGKIAPLPIAAILIVAGLLVRFRSSRASHRVRLAPHTLVFLIAWAFLLPMLFFLVSLTTETNLFVPRYFLSTAPGLALLAACLLRRTAGASARQAVAVSFVLLAILSTIPGFAVFGTFWHSNEDWRGALAKVRVIAGGTQMPVLVSPGFVEGSDPATLTNPERADCYLAPLKPYPGAGQVIPLPYRYSRLARPYFEEVVAKTLVRHDRFLVIARGDATIYQSWLEAKVPGLRVKPESGGNFGQLTVTLFTLKR